MKLQQKKQDFPGEARYVASAFSMMGKGYLACGVYQESSDQKYLNDIWVYDKASDIWTQVNTSYPEKGRVIENRLILGDVLRSEVAAWTQHRNNESATIDWQFKNEAARIKLK